MRKGATKRYLFGLLLTAVLGFTFSFLCDGVDVSTGVFYLLLFMIFVPWEIIVILYAETGHWNPKKALDSIPVREEDEDA